MSVSKELTHLDKQGQASMVDVGAKPSSHRRAVAGGHIVMHADTLSKIKNNTHKKGDVLCCARLAGIMAAKKTADVIPLCHSLSLTAIQLSFQLQEQLPAVYVTAATEVYDRTGAEMEALNAVQVALLTIYDMCKAVDRGMLIKDVHLIEKSGGSSGDWHQPNRPKQKTP